ncbi:MAG TPA: hypothetical protein V6C86_16630 [Oculatellaceae cyanobacterium]
MITAVQADSKSSSSQNISPEEFFLQILYQDDSSWKLRLPKELSSYQAELEQLLAKVFADRHSSENFALAQQLAVNWCFSKCRQNGISVEDCLKSA